MSSSDFKDEYKVVHEKRYVRTLNFMDGLLKVGDKVLDLGPPNPFSNRMEEKGLEVYNTEVGIDLDLDYDIVKDDKYDVVTAFEIFEHMVSPFPLLKSIKAGKLIASVPLKLWFKNAHWNDADPFDRHYHEFETRQFDMLLSKSGWKIEKSELWKSPSSKIGIRPFLRKITNRYYIVYCTR